ncbi:hypothetical protein C7T35_15325 [Variovorax sp. WS11]|nr:hypothetical protein C7T35_15325 [Variovorax sp. WS11]
MNVFDTGPMVDGISVDLGRMRAESGREFLVLLQYGGQVHHSGSSSSLVDGKWVRVPAPPTAYPVITLTPDGGGPRSTYAAASFLEAARAGEGFLIASLYKNVDVDFDAASVSALAAGIERAIPASTGSFAVRWLAVQAEPDYVPF